MTTVGGGTTVVKATSNENSAVSGSVNLEVITVQSVRIKDGSIYPISKDMTVGATTYLTAVVTPTNVTDSSVVWNSNNHGIVTVDQMGKVTAVSKGTAVISAVSKENQETHGSITINVSVSGETHLAFISAVNAIPDPKNVTDEDNYGCGNSA